MTRVVIINDVHLADRPPSIRTETYTDDIFTKLAWVVDYALAEADAVVFSGDLFHVKTPSRTSHALVQRLCGVIRPLQDAHMDVLAVPGNHDLSHDRLDSLDRQPLGTLFKAGVIPAIGETPFFTNSTLFGVPWLQDWERELPDYMERWKGSSAQLMVTHAPIVRTGETRPYFTIETRTWALAMARQGDVAYGHMHDPDGVTSPVTGFRFANEGALARGTIHESTLARKPAVTLWDSRTGFERVEVPHKPAEEVFRLAEHRAEETSSARLDEFLGKIGSTTLERVSIEVILADLKARGIAPEVLTEVEDCLETVT